MFKNSKTFFWASGIVLGLASMFIFEVELVKKVIDPLTVVFTAFFLFIVLAFSYSLNSLFHNEKLENSITDLKEAMKSINMGWLLPEAEIVKFEREADEIWVIQNSLEKDYDLDNEIGKAVRSNLSKKKFIRYVYFLPIHAYTSGQVKSFENTFNEYEGKFKFVLVANDSIFIHSEIVLYNPINDDERNAVEFLPSNNETDNKIKYYVDLDKDRADYIWSLGNMLIEKDKYGVDHSMFLLDDSVAKIETEAKKVWVIKNELGYDILETFDDKGKKNGHPIQQAVQKNLENGCEYTYFLLDDTNKKNIEDRKIFEKMYKNYEEYFQFIPLSNHGLFIHSEIAIYNPGSTEMSAIELVASQDPKKPPIYVKLTENSVESIYNICNKIKKDEEKNLNQL
jgi:preprotein translocase subunit SecG